ncbi:MAG: OmpA family protein [Granulosicoccus sp.]
MSYEFIGGVKPAMMIAGVVLLSGCSAPGSLKSDTQFDRRIYAGAGLLLSQLEPDTSAVTGLNVDESDSTGVSLSVGYDVNDRLSIEGHVADLGDATLSPDGSVSYQVAGLSGLVYGLNSQQNRHRRHGVSLFGRVGLGALTNDAEVVRVNRINDVHLLAGAGVEYGFKNGVATRVELIGHETDAMYAQIAMLYRFGRQTDGPGKVDIASSDSISEPGKNDEQDVEVIPLPQPEPAVIDEQKSGIAPETGDSSDGQLQEPVSEGSPIDEDLDGVTDEVDDCPGTASGLPVNATGCEIFDGAIEGVHFRVGSAELTEGAIAVLTGIVGTLRQYLDIKVTIEAHTDNRGDAQQNLQLSKRRALAVARFLVDEGISGLRLKPQAYGESQPRASNATPAGRTANRRVEFRVFK